MYSAYLGTGVAFMIVCVVVLCCFVMGVHVDSISMVFFYCRCCCCWTLELG